MTQPSLIAVVDDDPPFLDSLRRLIRALGHAAITFGSASDFLASGQLAATACLVADVHMPAMTGVELYRRLVETGCPIPTILITAYPDDRVEQEVLSQGVACYLRKPLEEAMLIDCLHRAVAPR